MFISHFRRNFFWYIVGVLTLLSVAASLYRFGIARDYIVSYEGECDPYTESCFLYCEDDECSEPFYYSIIERNAAEIYAQCGEDVTTCDEAYECPLDVPSCSITFCDPVLDEDQCESLSEEDLSVDDSTVEDWSDVDDSVVAESLFEDLSVDESAVDE